MVTGVLSICQTLKARRKSSCFVCLVQRCAPFRRCHSVTPRTTTIRPRDSPRKPRMPCGRTSSTTQQTVGSTRSPLGPRSGSRPRARLTRSRAPPVRREHTGSNTPTMKCKFGALPYTGNPCSPTRPRWVPPYTEQRRPALITTPPVLTHTLCTHPFVSVLASLSHSLSPSQARAEPLQAPPAT